MRKLLIAFLCSAAWAQIASPILGASGSSVAAIAFVNAASANCAAPATCAASLSPTAGNRVIVDVWSQQAVTVVTVADNIGTASYVANGAGYTTTSNITVREFQACNVPAGVTTITATMTGTVQSTVIIARQYSGGTCAADQGFTTGHTDIAQTTQTGTAITPASGFNEIVSVASIQVGSTTPNFATSGLYVNRANRIDATSGDLAGVGDQLVTSTTGSYTGTQTTTPTAVTTSTFTTSYK